MEKLGTEYMDFEICRTGKEEELVNQFMDFLLEHSPHYCGWDEYIEELEILYDNISSKEETISFLTSELWDIMKEIAPEGCYFGSYLSYLDDGCSYGFWEIQEVGKV